MKDSVRYKIEMLRFMQSKGSDLSSIIVFLVDNKILSSQEHEVYKTSNNKIEAILTILEKIKSSDRVQLVDYLFTLLPVAEAKLTIVADSSIFNL
jgi:hypothetical protein